MNVAVLETPSSLQESWQQELARLGTPKAILACTYTFQADFFARLRDALEAAASKSKRSTTDTLALVPIDIVCDASRYSGHPVGWNVTLWPETTRLFHPKLFIVLFEDEIVWSDGSLNLTTSGWMRNREVAMLHRPGTKALPAGLRQLLKAMLTVRSAQIILESTVDLAPHQMPGFFASSYRQAIGHQFIAQAPDDAQEVHLVAPFFEQRESATQAIDQAWLKALVKRYPDAQFHIYLPLLEQIPLRVQGERKVFVDAQASLNAIGSGTITLRPVAPDPGPLHGKIACIVHRRGRATRATMMVGSPNMTRAALLEGPDSGNIEVAWFFNESWKTFEPILSNLSAKSYLIEDVLFSAPRIEQIPSWPALKIATFDPLRKELTVEWRESKYAAITTLKYANKTLSFSKNGAVSPFTLEPDVCWLDVIKTGSGGRIKSRCPIHIAVAFQELCKQEIAERTAEEWLQLLGSVLGGGVGPATKQMPRAKRKRAHRVPVPDFTWSERVRELAARTRFLEVRFSAQDGNRIEHEWLKELFFHILHTHTLDDAKDDTERVWRMWVGIEFWQAANRIARTAASRAQRHAWHEHATTVNTMLQHRLRQLPGVLQQQFKSAIDSLEGR